MSVGQNVYQPHGIAIHINFKSQLSGMHHLIEIYAENNHAHEL